MAAAAAHPVLVGTSHRTAPDSLRDRLFVDEGASGALLDGLAAAGLGQAVVIATCDRIEAISLHADPAQVAAAVQAALAAQGQVPPEEIGPCLYRLAGEAAVRHLFAVAASLESRVIGEPHVLGQLRAAHEAARALGMVGGELEGLLQAAYVAAKRVRSETTIGQRPVSVAGAAAEVARGIHGDLGGAGALLIGAGELAELILTQLQGTGLRRLEVLHRAPRRAEALARRLGGNVRAPAELAAALAGADIVIATQGSGSYALAARDVADALTTRRRVPIFLIDLAQPRDVEPRVADLDGAFLYDLDDLERIAWRGLSGREAEREAAWRIVDAELAAWRRARDRRRATPAIVALRRRFEAARQEVLAAGADLPAAEATRLLVNRLLHDPSEALGEIAALAEEDPAAAERLLVRLFRLEQTARGGTEDGDT